VCWWAIIIIIIIIIIRVALAHTSDKVADAVIVPVKQTPGGKTDPMSRGIA